MNEPKKKKPGRPPKEPWQGLKNPISLHLDDGDYAELMSKVEESGLSRNQFCIRAINNVQIRKALDEEERKQMRDLQGIANNLKQLAKGANTFGFPRIADKLDSLLNTVLKFLSKFRM